MNKLTLAVLTFLMCTVGLKAQGLKPVKWTFTVEQTSKTEAVLVFRANIEKDWHIYSQFTPDGGPLPTVFMFDENKNIELVGKVTEPAPHEEYDSTFEVKVLTLNGDTEFRQKIKLNGPVAEVTGKVEGQVCKDACIMFGDTFRFTVGPF